ncbi:IniB N-terminal domain-containing protein [Haloechinothrix halophila]|uniref:IniB N-terminal domain-containing protein n=1 Tax=Haloechinothrix halophila TaxID=1069073 RepID=UPI0004214833|nr:IniB N-terminal domain-containing protein [Haloechinothrix halophila]
MQPPETLYDFVATLLSDATARSDFGADPTGTLAEAGLQDITPQDVQEVVPLVLAYAPNAGLASLEARLSELPSDPAAAVEHLQVVAQSAAEENVMAPSSLNMGADGGYDGDPFSSALSGNGGLDGFAGEMASESEFGSMTGDAWGSQESLGLAGTMTGAQSSGAAGARGDLDGVESAMVAGSPLGSFTGTSQLSADGAAGEFEAAGSEMDFESDGHFGASTDKVHGGGSGDSQLGSVYAHGAGGPDGFEFNSHGDPGSSLDGDTLAKGGEAAAGTVAGYVSSGGDAFASQISNGGDALGAFLTGTARTGSDYIGSGADYTAGHVSSGSDELAGRIEQAPAQLQSPGEFGTSQVQDARSELPSSDDLPTGGLPTGGLPTGGLPTNGLPTGGDLPDAGVPSELPNLPVENPLPDAPGTELPEAQQPSLNTVEEGVSNSPLDSAVPQDVPTPGLGDGAGDLGIGG